MSPRRIAVFGGTGFLGRRIVRRLLAHGFAVRVAARHAERGDVLFGAQDGLETLCADIGDDASVAAAVKDAWGVVNAVSLYVERDALTFHAIHVAGAGRVAAQARRAGVARLVHVSGIGADPNSKSSYIRSRGDGEQAVRQAFPGATVIHPSAMVGSDDALIHGLAGLIETFPVFPLFGRGRTKLQPAHVEDVGEAVARILESDKPAPLYALGGPQVLSYRALVETIAWRLGRKPILLPVPFALWRLAGAAAERMKNPPLTRNQVELMETDNVAGENLPGFDALGIAPKGVDAVLATLPDPSRPRESGDPERQPLP